MVTVQKHKKSQAECTKNASSIMAKSKKAVAQVSKQAKPKLVSSSCNKKVLPSSEGPITRRRLKARELKDCRFVAIEPVKKSKRVRLTERQREKFTEQNENALFFEEGFSHSNSVPLIARLPSEYMVDSQSQSSFASCKKATKNDDVTDFCNFAPPQLKAKGTADNSLQKDLSKNEKENKEDGNVNCISTNDSVVIEKDSARSAGNQIDVYVKNPLESDVWLEKSDDSEDETLDVCIRRRRKETAASRGRSENITESGESLKQAPSMVKSEAGRLEKGAQEALETQKLEASELAVGNIESKENERTQNTDVENDGVESEENPTGNCTRKIVLSRTDSGSSLSKKILRKFDVKSKDIRAFLSPKSNTSPKASEMVNAANNEIICEEALAKKDIVEGAEVQVSKHKKILPDGDGMNEECKESVLELALTPPTEIAASASAKTSITVAPVLLAESALVPIGKSCGRKRGTNRCCKKKNEVVEVKGPDEVMELSSSVKENLNDGHPKDSVSEDGSGSTVCMNDMNGIPVESGVSKEDINKVVSKSENEEGKDVLGVGSTVIVQCEKVTDDLKVAGKGETNFEEFKAKAENIEKCVANIIALPGSFTVKADEKVDDEVRTPVKSVVSECMSQSEEKRTPGILKKSPSSATKANTESSLRKRVHFDANAEDDYEDVRANKVSRHGISPFGRTRRRQRCGALFHSPEEKTGFDPPVVPFNMLLQSEEVKLQKPLIPELTDMKDILTPKLLTKLSPYGVQSLRVALKSRGIKTVGDLARLTESEISTLPVRAPKVETVRDVLCEHAKIVPSSLKKPGDRAFWKVSSREVLEKDSLKEKENLDVLKASSDEVEFKERGANCDSHAILQDTQMDETNIKIKGQSVLGEKNEAVRTEAFSSKEDLVEGRAEKQSSVPEAVTIEKSRIEETETQSSVPEAVTVEKSRIEETETQSSVPEAVTVEKSRIEETETQSNVPEAVTVEKSRIEENIFSGELTENAAVLTLSHSEEVENKNNTDDKEVQGVSKSSSDDCVLPCHDNESPPNTAEGEGIEVNENVPFLDALFPKSLLNELKDACVVLKRHKQGYIQSHSEKTEACNTLCKVIQACTENLLRLHD